MENIALVIAAILGSTGIASLANSLTSWGRRSKLRNSINQMNEDIKSMQSGSAEREACKVSISIQALELASLSLIRATPAALWMMAVAFGTLFFIFVFTDLLPLIQGEEAPENTLINLNPTTFFLLGYFIFLVLGQFASIQYFLARRRHRFVSDAWNAGHANRELILKHSAYLRYEQHFRKRQTSNPRDSVQTKFSNTKPGSNLDSDQYNI